MFSQRLKAFIFPILPSLVLLGPTFLFLLTHHLHHNSHSNQCQLLHKPPPLERQQLH